MFDPKWLVLGVFVAAFALLANYDVQLGIAAGTLLGIAAIVYFWARLRLWMADHEPGDTRRTMVERFRKLTDNRRRARDKELSGE